jgi:hypothetical protein
MNATSPASLPPGALNALTDLLGDFQRYRPKEVLTLVSALEELATTLEESASGKKPAYSSDISSLRHDVDRSILNAGPALRRLTSPTLDDFRKTDVEKLTEVFEDPSDCTRVAADARGIIGQLASAAGVESAWDDLIDSLDDGATTCASSALAVAQLAELSRLRGHDWEALTMSMRGALLGKRLSDPLGEARSTVGSAPPDNVRVVWVAFGNAELPQGYQRLGQAQFFRDQLTPENIRDGCPALHTPEFERADELDDTVINTHLRSVNAKRYVLARVEITGPRAHAPAAGRGKPPIEWARDYASGLVEAAAFRSYGTDWVLLDGGFYVTEGGEAAGSTSFEDPRRRQALETFRAPIYEPTGRALADLKPAFADALARGDSAAVRAVAEVLWHRGARAVEDPAMRIALLVRGFETQWTTGANAPYGSWNEPVKIFWRDHWVRGVMDDTLHAAAFHIRHMHHLAPRPERLKAATSAIYSNTTSIDYSWKPREVIAHVELVGKDFVTGSLPRRLTTEVARLTRSGSAAQVWWTQLRGAFDTLLNRAVRQRNAVVHGRTVVPEVVESVSPFLVRLTETLVAQLVYEASEGFDVDAELAKARDHLTDLHRRLPSQASGAALYDPAP